MTTIIVHGDKMLCDGQITSGERIDSYNFKKIRKINGCVIGGAGRLSSVLAFFDWFDTYSNSLSVKSSAPEVEIMIPEGINDDDFTGLVMFTDGEVFLYEGGKRCYPVFNPNYYAIGSGADWALAALDAGATPEEALEIAKKRDVYSGGETFIEKLEPEDDMFESRDKADQYTKEQLLDNIFGKEESSNATQEVVTHLIDVDKILTEMTRKELVVKYEQVFGMKPGTRESKTTILTKLLEAYSDPDH